MAGHTFTATIPTHLDEIPLVDFIEWNQIPEEDNEERSIQALKIFCGVQESHLRDRKIPQKVVHKALEGIKSVLDVRPPHRPLMTLNGKKWGFIPNLDNLSTGEFIDLTEYLKDPRDLWKAMAVLYRPVIKEGQGGRYLIEPYSKEYSQDLPREMQQMPTGYAIGARVFFYTIGTDLLNSTQRFLGRMRVDPQMSSIWEKNGDGLDLYTSSVEEMSQRWRLSQLCPYPRLSSGRLTRQTWQKLRKQ